MRSLVQLSKMGFSITTLVALSLMTDRALAQQEPSDTEKKNEARPSLVKGGYLGVHVIMLTPELREFFGAAQGAGILVSKVDKGSPAFKGGIEVGDVIEKADGKDVVSVWVLERIVNEKKSREILLVQVLRSKKTRILKVTMEERQRPQFDVGQIFQWHGPGRGQMQVEIMDPRIFINASERFREHFKEPMILARMEEMQRLIEREKKLELRIKKLENRILQLEAQLRE